MSGIRTPSRGASIAKFIQIGNILLMGANDTEIEHLQHLQNWAAKLIFLTSKKDHAIPFLKQLHWLPVKQRVHFALRFQVSC